MVHQTLIHQYHGTGHGGMDAHFHFVQGDEIPGLHIAARVHRFQQERTFLLEAIGHFLHLFRGQIISPHSYRTGIAAPGFILECNRMERFHTISSFAFLL